MSAMEAYLEWLDGFVNLLTVAAIVSTFTTSLRVAYDRDSSDVAFWPIALTMTCSYAWFMYGYALYDHTLIWLNVFSMASAGANTAVHHLFSRDPARRWYRLAATSAVLCVMCAASPKMTVESLGHMASGSAVVCGLAALVRVQQVTPVPEMAFWTMTCSWQWLQKAVTEANVPLIICHAGGIALTVTELMLSFWLLVHPEFPAEWTLKTQKYV
ncbi:hypothetical protein HPB50_023703 [Hyalomma asiaticum]|uniref:Uncharacterized protein n=1 Tax=Hyalomma asiaticum TaxID=266040 RepID=A0ACB7T6W0_HYAAI|nr:hypothetical protein HPB50_023703 [Hyalomma asiaticum]